MIINGWRRITRYRYVAVLFLILFTAQTHAENWIEIAAAEGKFKGTMTILSIDSDSIKVVDGLTRYWIKQQERDSGNGKIVLEALRLNAANCSNDTNAELSAKLTNDGAGASSKLYSKNSDDLIFEVSTPGSVNHDVIDVACSWSEGSRLPIRPNWKPLEAISNQAYIDTASIVAMDDDKVYAWSRIDDSKIAKHVYLYYSYKCSENTLARIGVGISDRIGPDIIDTFRMTRIANHQYSPIPSKADKYLFDYVCGYKSSVIKKIPIETDTKAIKYGTGFFINKQGVVATNYHVIDHCSRISVRYNGQVYPAKLAAIANFDDLALLHTKIASSSANFRRSIPNVGESVYAAGFPLPGVLDGDMNFTNGAISSSDGIGGDITTLQISTPVQVGNSGGPLLDEYGQVVGVVTGKLDTINIAKATGDIPQNVNFAIKGVNLQMFLDLQGATYTLTERSKKLDPVEIAKHAKNFTVQVMCN